MLKSKKFSAFLYFCQMFADIHSHKFSAATSFTVCNLTVNQAEKIIDNNIIGFFSVGLHPCFPEDLSQQMFDKLTKLAENYNPLAIGECGLDKNSTVGLAEQTLYFEKQIILAEYLQKPLIIHCVGRFNELLEIRKSIRPSQKWIIHGFRGKPQLAEQLLKAGCALSYGEKFNPESVKITDTDNLFVETDESLLPIENIYQRIAKIKQCDIQDINAGNKMLNIEKKYLL
ncbi:MAG: TatD family hydrolase [Paludibacter sp.]|nr:TatD family hydrolase [Paludibacter sp.]